jgi:hypothetical protein
MRHWDEMKYCLVQVNAASQRSRNVFLALFLSTALLSAFDWTTRSSGWSSLRIVRRQELLDRWDQLQKAGKGPDDQGLSDQDHLGKMGEGDRERLKGELKDLLKSNDQPFRLPFLDLDFDPNDADLFGEMEASVLTLVLVFCLSREEKNLSIFFNKCRGLRSGEYRDAYWMASMGQVLNLPDPPACGGIFWRLGQWILFSLPAAALGVIVVNDLVENKTSQLSPVIGPIQHGFMVLCAILLLGFASWCTKIFLRIEDSWERNKPKDPA